MTIFVPNINELISRRYVRYYSFCCPPRRPAGQCGCPPMVPGSSSQIRPPVECRPIKIPPNPCCPRFHQGNWRKYKLLFFLVCLPLILIQYFNTCGHKTPDKGECRDFEYMRRRFKKYPWRDGVQTFLHNERVNHVPGECTPPPLDCD